MSLTRRHWVFAALSLLLLVDTAIIVASRYEAPANASFMAFIGVPAQATLLAWWTIYGSNRLASRLAGLILVGILLWLVMFRAHAIVRMNSGWESAFVASMVVGAHLGFGLLGFLAGRFALRLRLVSGTYDEPVEGQSSLQFGLRQMLAWTACAAALAFLARFALEDCDWSLARTDLTEVGGLTIMLGVVSLLAPPCAMLILSVEVLEWPRTWAFGGLFLTVCILENLAMAILLPLRFDSELFVCECCGSLFLNAFQLIPIVFAFWIVRLFNYRMF